MALTEFQRAICRLLARRRIEGGESYVAGGVALNEALHLSRISRDIDLFHDTIEAVDASWTADRSVLQEAGLDVRLLRERPAYVEAEIRGPNETVLIEWARDSAFRFFPLVTHADLGLTLHPFDLATNKVLALVGRLEPRDWVDLIHAAEQIQPLGYLAWAATGKDPGFSPTGILAIAARTARYSADEIGRLAFAGDPPAADDLARRWHAMLAAASEVIDLLPLDQVGHSVLGSDGTPFRGDTAKLQVAIDRAALRFHPGRIGGAWPELK